MMDVKQKKSREELLMLIFDERNLPTYVKGVLEEDLDYFILRLKRLPFYQKSLALFSKLMDSISTQELERIYEMITDEVYKKYTFIKRESDVRVMGEMLYEDLQDYDALVHKFQR